jgi:uncharacterized protein with HEPN domain
MERDPRMLLWDVRDSAQAIIEFTAGLGYRDYLAQRLVRSGVERQFAVIGEALGKLARLAPDLAERIPGWRGAIGMRNVVVHGYADIDHDIVWQTIQTRLPEMITATSALLSELGEEP